MWCREVYLYHRDGLGRLVCLNRKPRLSVIDSVVGPESTRRDGSISQTPTAISDWRVMCIDEHRQAAGKIWSAESFLKYAQEPS